MNAMNHEISDKDLKITALTKEISSIKINSVLESIPILADTQHGSTIKTM